MSDTAWRGFRGGWAWVILIAVPPLIIVAGLVAMFAWQAGKGGVRPKWQKPPATATNQVTPAEAPRDGMPP